MKVFGVFFYDFLPLVNNFALTFIEFAAVFVEDDGIRVMSRGGIAGDCREFGWGCCGDVYFVLLAEFLNIIESMNIAHEDEFDAFLAEFFIFADDFRQDGATFLSRLVI